MAEQVLLTGATGFIGQHLHAPLVQAGHSVRCLTRRPEEARARWPDRDWVGGDVGDPGSLVRAMEGCGTAYYLVHGMASARPGWAERRAALGEGLRRTQPARPASGG